MGLKASSQSAQKIIPQFGMHSNTKSAIGPDRLTGLLPHETGGWCHPFSHVGINVDHKKRVDLGVLRGADHDGLGEQTPF